MRAPADLRFGFQPASIIVTGAASGIGRATAKLAADQGLAVIGWDVDAYGLAAMRDEIVAAGGSFTGYVADITSPQSVQHAMQASARNLAPRYLVNNAGPPSTAALRFDAAIAGSLIATQCVTRRWLEAEPADPVLVNVVSIAGNLLGLAEWYSAAKAGIMGYTRHLAVGRPHRLRANAVAPGLINTPRVQDTLVSDRGRDIVSRNPMRRVGEPEEIASVVLFLLSPAAAYVNGAMVVADGGSSLTF
jgi:NAD(P)-dependent dehydrogenase (short-subunit alcohol dehydrogenase family)